MQRAAAVLVAILCALACQARDLIVWGMASSSDAKGQEAIDRAFERLHPGLMVKQLRMASGTVASQKLLTSIVGGVPPDVVQQDRFTLADWASRGAFQTLDLPQGERFVASALDSCRYGGKLYALPLGADSRALYWNKAVFRARRKQLLAAGLDPGRPPRTWTELLAYSRVLTQFQDAGSLKMAGFIPNFGNAWLYLYAVQNGASFISGSRCTLAAPETEQALEFMTKGYDQLGGYENALAFESGFLSKEDNPFFSGRLAMMVDGDWTLGEIARYAPGLEFGVAPPPVPDAWSGQPRSWSGGFCLCIPVGARHLADAREYVPFCASADAQLIGMRAQAAWDRGHGRPYVPTLSANLDANERSAREFALPRSFAAGLTVHQELLSSASSRPVTPVAQLLWDEHIRAMDLALYHKLSPAAALEQAQATVQRSLDSRTAQLAPVDQQLVPYGFTGLLILGAVGVWSLYSRRRLRRLARHEARWAYLFVSPWVIGFVVFTFGPMLVSLFWSFTDYSALAGPRWVGLNNYAEMAGADGPTLYKAFFNSGFVAVFGVPLGIVTGLSLALLLNTCVRGQRFYRAMFYMPAIVSGVASSVVWGWLLMPDPSQGLVNGLWYSTITQWLHLPPPGWMASEAWSKHTLILIGVWGAGSGIILWLAGLNSISKSLYESASLDGASPWQQFWKITVPQLSPLIFFMSVAGFIGALQEFDRVYVLKGSDGPVGPADSLLTPVYHLFDVGFGQFRLGYASAIAWVLFALIVAVTVIQFKLAPRWVSYEAD